MIRRVEVDADWFLTLWNALLPEERCTYSGIQDRPTLVIDRRCPAENGATVTHNIIFVANVGKKRFGEMLEEQGVSTRPQLTESPFDYDVWQCPECAYVVTDVFYKGVVADFDCPGCSGAKLSQFHLRKAQSKTIEPQPPS